MKRNGEVEVTWGLAVDDHTKIEIVINYEHHGAPFHYRKQVSAIEITTEAQAKLAIAQTIQEFTLALQASGLHEDRRAGEVKRVL